MLNSSYSTEEEIAERLSESHDYGWQLPDSALYVSSQIRGLQIEISNITGVCPSADEVHHFLTGTGTILENPDAQTDAVYQQSNLSRIHTNNADVYNDRIEGAQTSEQMILEDPALTWVATHAIPFANRYYHDSKWKYLDKVRDLKDVARDCPVEHWKPDWKMPLPSLSYHLATDSNKSRRQSVGTGMLRDINDHLLLDRGLAIHEGSLQSNYNNMHETRSRFFAIGHVERNETLTTEDGISVDCRFMREAYPFTSSLNHYGSWTNVFEAAEIYPESIITTTRKQMEAFDRHVQLGSKESIPRSLLGSHRAVLELGRANQLLYGTAEHAAVALQNHCMCEETRHGISHKRFQRDCSSFGNRMFRQHVHNMQNFADYMCTGGHMGILPTQLTNLIADLEELTGLAHETTFEYWSDITTAIMEIDGKMTGMAVGGDPKTALSHCRALIKALEEALANGFTPEEAGLNLGDMVVHIGLILQLAQQMGLEVQTGNTFDFNDIVLLCQVLMSTPNPVLRKLLKDRYAKIFRHGTIDEAPYPEIDSNGKLRSRGHPLFEECVEQDRGPVTYHRNTHVENRLDAAFSQWPETLAM